MHYFYDFASEREMETTVYDFRGLIYSLWRVYFTSDTMRMTDALWLPQERRF